MQEPDLVVVGEQVALGALRRELVPVYLRWRSDVEVLRGLGDSSRVPTLESTTAWYEEATRPGAAEVHFTVYDRTDTAPVGTASLVRVNHHEGTAEFGVVIGERRGRGLGTEATRLTLDWAFTAMNLHNVLLVTFDWNHAALRAYTRAGFREIGRRRGAIVTLGQRHDQVLMDATADDFTSPVLGRYRPPAPKPRPREAR